MPQTLIYTYVCVFIKRRIVTCRVIQMTPEQGSTAYNLHQERLQLVCNHHSVTKLTSCLYLTVERGCLLCRLLVNPALAALQLYGFLAVTNI